MRITTAYWSISNEVISNKIERSCVYMNSVKKLKLKLPDAARWFSGILMTAAALAHAVPADAPAIDFPPFGYYRIERVTEISIRPTPNPETHVYVTMRSKDGRSDWESHVGSGKPEQRSFDSQPEYQCLSKTLPANQLSRLSALCPAGPGQGCNVSRDAHVPQAQRLGPKQWKLTIPLQLSDLNASDSRGVDQLERALRNGRTAPGLSPQERAIAQEALRQLPTGSAVRQSYTDAANTLDALAMQQGGPYAELLKEHARRLRVGKTGGEIDGETVEYWTRIADRCPG